MMNGEKPTEEEVKAFKEKVENDPLLQEFLKIGNTHDMAQRKVLDHIYYLHKELEAIKSLLKKEDNDE